MQPFRAHPQEMDGSAFRNVDVTEPDALRAAGESAQDRAAIWGERGPGGDLSSLGAFPAQPKGAVSLNDRGLDGGEANHGVGRRRDDMANLTLVLHADLRPEPRPGSYMSIR